MHFKHKMQGEFIEIVGKCQFNILHSTIYQAFLSNLDHHRIINTYVKPYRIIVHYYTEIQFKLFTIQWFINVSLTLLNVYLGLVTVRLVE